MELKLRVLYCNTCVCFVRVQNVHVFPFSMVLRECMRRAGVLGGLGIGIVSTLLEPGVSRALESDEFEEVFDDDAIGIELEDVSDMDQLTPVTGKLFCRINTNAGTRNNCHSKTQNATHQPETWTMLRLGGRSTHKFGCLHIPVHQVNDACRKWTRDSPFARVFPVMP